MIYNPSYKIKKKINFDNKMENNFFLNQLKKSKIYLEYGSGPSSPGWRISPTIHR